MLTKEQVKTYKELDKIVKERLEFMLETINQEICGEPFDGLIMRTEFDHKGNFIVDTEEYIGGSKVNNYYILADRWLYEKDWLKEYKEKRKELYED